MKILFTPYGGGSMAHIVRSFPIARELQHLGHEVLFTTTKSKKSFIEGQGFKTFGSGHPDVNLNDEDDQSVKYFRDHRREFIEWFQDEINAVYYFKPDVIVNSPSFFGAISGKKTNTQYVTILNSQWLTTFQGLMGLGLSDKKFSNNLLRKFLHPIFTKKFEKLYLEEIKTFYKELEIDSVPQKRSDLHSDHRIIIPGVPEFEPLEINHKSVSFVGPIFWEGFESERFHPSMHFKDHAKPLIYITLGGSIFRKDSYEKLISSFNRRKEWNIVLSIGPNFTREKFQSDNEHFIIRQFVPGLGVNEHAKVMVNTASHGSVMQALWHGTPIVAIPHNIDQATIASRIKELGIGINLNPIGFKDFTNREVYFKKALEVTSEDIENAVNEILNNYEKYQKNILDIQASLKKYPNAHKRAAQIILEHAKNR